MIGQNMEKPVKELTELEQYRKLGTLEECKKSIEKQEPKKPITYKATNRADCPCCKKTVRGIGKKFGDWCSGCGQRIDWSEYEI